MSLDRASAVQIALGLQVRLVGKLGGVKPAKAFHLARDSNGRNPSVVALAQANTKKAGAVVAARLDHVLHVDHVSDLSKVVQPVVVLDAVGVVKVSGRPVPEHVQPSKPMSPVRTAVNANLYVPVMIHEVGNCPCTLATSRDFPSERSTLKIVVKKLAQTLRGKIGLSHEALQLLIGQRPAAIRSRLWASLFSPLSLGRAS